MSNDFNQKEPYPNFYVTLHELMLGQIEYTRLRVFITKVAIGIAIAYVILNILLCILSIVLPLFGISIFTWLLQQLPTGMSLDGGI
jgi:hypothetical protein